MTPAVSDDPADDRGDSTTLRREGVTPDPGHGRWLSGVLRRIGIVRRSEAVGRGTLGELIEAEEERETVLGADERVLVANILKARHSTAEDVMVPRADIVSIDAQATLAEVIALMTKTGHSRIPVYRETLDDVIGMVHIKDILAWRGQDADFQLAKLLRRVLFVAPSMEVLQLLLEMRSKRSHMALVVDEYGGIDGLLTIEDVVEEIVGEIADEHDRAVEPAVTPRPDGSLDADARADVEVLDAQFGNVLSEQERDDVDTVGGLVVSLAGRVPARGEIVSHPEGLEFEVLDADLRRIKRVRIRRLGGGDAAVPAERPTGTDP
jgi:CBS domain containing-hemolysin-like protein